LTRHPWTVGLVAVIAVVLCSVAADAAPLPGVRTLADRAQWRSLLRWPASCERSWRKTRAAGARIDVWPARHGAHLVAVQCFRGAYQGLSMLYILPAHGPARDALRFRIYVDPGNGVPRVRTRTAILGDLSFRPTSGRLTIFDRARGLGDCGIYSVFRLRAGAFVPVEARAKTVCDAKAPFDPRRWPKLSLP
jgi:hypothetical protein